MLKTEMEEDNPSDLNSEPEMRRKKKVTERVKKKKKPECLGAHIFECVKLSVEEIHRETLLTGAS